MLRLTKNGVLYKAQKGNVNNTTVASTMNPSVTLTSLFCMNDTIFGFVTIETPSNIPINYVKVNRTSNKLITN